MTETKNDLNTPVTDRGHIAVVFRSVVTNKHLYSRSLILEAAQAGWPVYDEARGVNVLDVIGRRSDCAVLMKDLLEVYGSHSFVGHVLKDMMVEPDYACAIARFAFMPSFLISHFGHDTTWVVPEHATEMAELGRCFDILDLYKIYCAKPVARNDWWCNPRVPWGPCVFDTHSDTEFMIWVMVRYTYATGRFHERSERRLLCDCWYACVKSIAPPPEWIDLIDTRTSGLIEHRSIRAIVVEYCLGAQSA